MLLPDFKRGDSFELPLSVTERSDTGVMVAVDITNWLFKMDAREETAAGRIVQSFAFDIVDALAGKGVFVASTAATRRWPLKTLVLDISIRDSEGKEVTSKTMQMTVGERVTR